MLAIIELIVIGILIFKLNNDKKTEIQKSTELQSQVNSLNKAVNALQGKTKTVSETVKQENTNKTTQNNDIVNKKRISGNFTQNSPDDKGSYWFDAAIYILRH